MKATCVSMTASEVSVRRLSVTSQSNNQATQRSSSKPRLKLPTILGPAGRAHQVSLYEHLANDGGSGRLWSPYVQLSVSPEEYASLPVMFYLPGFDGTGLAATRQFPRLMEAFDFMAFSIPLDDRTPFTELVDLFISYLKHHIGDSKQGRPVYLLGESFGALLALAAASKCPEHVDRLVLVNPATSYEQSIWPVLGPLIPQIPNELYSGVSFALAPLLGNPLSLLSYRIDLTQSLPSQLNNIIEGVLELFGTLGFLGDIFTPERVAWKLELLQQGFQFTSPLIPKIEQRTLLLVSDGDWMLPSENEKNRLTSLMRRCFARSLGMRSHAVLQEGGVDLVQILKEEGFYVRQRRFSAHGESQVKLNAFGTAFPIELPTEKERKKVSGVFDVLNKLHSSVYYSTTLDNRVVHGLNALPEGRPLLMIGNHQLLAPDTALLVEGLIRQKDMLVRGLTHPLIFEAENREKESDAGIGFFPGGSRRMANMMTTYGAVRVSPKNLHTLLQQGERILLYPGGARESFKLKNDETYQLFWPEKPEFVRMAAKFEATIVTIASVGMEDSLEIMLDREDALQMPFLQNIIEQQMQKTPEPRPGISARSGDFFIPPLVRPKVPQRQYFLFGRPFVTTLEHYNDKDKCQELYSEIKQDLQNNITYLREKSKADPYGDFLKRIVYENGSGRRQAPSFTP